jgi:hypothetical protein
MKIDVFRLMLCCGLIGACSGGKTGGADSTPAESDILAERGTECTVGAGLAECNFGLQCWPIDPSAMNGFGQGLGNGQLLTAGKCASTVALLGVIKGEDGQPLFLAGAHVHFEPGEGNPFFGVDAYTDIVGSFTVNAGALFKFPYWVSVARGGTEEPFEWAGGRTPEDTVIDFTFTPDASVSLELPPIVYAAPPASCDGQPYNPDCLNAMQEQCGADGTIHSGGCYQ